MRSSCTGAKRCILLAVVLVLCAAAGVAWVERKPLLAWYYLRQLSCASEADAPRWAERVASLDDGILPDLLHWLTQEERACTNARLALGCLVRRREVSDPRSVELAEQLVKSFPRLSTAGQDATLALSLEWVQAEASCPEALADALGGLLPETARMPEPSLLSPSLQLALKVVPHASESSLFCAARELAQKGLQDTRPTVRLQAVQLASQPRVQLNKDMVALLNDPEAEIRRVVMKVVGPDKKIIHDDRLLPWLHDSDAEVRRLCEQALTDRGIKPHYIRLGWLLTHPRWDVRLRVLTYLAEEEGLDARIWLRRLSHDPSPAVRVAVIRAACEDRMADLGDRIEQMAQQDPSATVADLARHYLRRSKIRPVSTD